MRRRLWVALCLWLACPAWADDWALADRAWLASYATLSTVDAVQTIHGIRSRKFEELNPALGSTPSDGKVIGVKLAAGGLLYWAADAWPEYRRGLLILGTGVELSVTAHNFRIGMSLGL